MKAKQKALNEAQAELDAAKEELNTFKNNRAKIKQAEQDAKAATEAAIKKQKELDALKAALEKAGAVPPANEGTIDDGGKVETLAPANEGTIDDDDKVEAVPPANEGTIDDDKVEAVPPIDDDDETVTDDEMAAIAAAVAKRRRTEHTTST